MSPRLPLSVLLTLLAACGSPADPADLAREGVLALNAKDYGPAYSNLSRAVRDLPTDHPRALEARVALCRTLAHGRADRCIDQLAELTEEREDLRVADAAMIVRELIRANEPEATNEAIRITKACFGDSETVQNLVNEAGDAARHAEASDALKDLESLGYTGGTERPADDDDGEDKPAER